MTGLSFPAAAETTSHLKDRVALVTGADGALGRQLCATFAAHGATVVGTDLTGEDCVRADIGTEAGNRAAVEAALERHGRLDILVLNAGVQHVAPLPDFPLARWQHLLDVMLTGPFMAMRAAWPALTARPGGRIVVVASTSSFTAERFKAAYVAAKHGVVGLVKVAALEGAAHGLTCNAVAPSWMLTPMVTEQVAERARLSGTAEEDMIAELVAEQAATRFVEPSEVAETVAFLAGPHATAITGACVPVDLGALA